MKLCALDGIGCRRLSLEQLPQSKHLEALALRTGRVSGKFRGEPLRLPQLAHRGVSGREPLLGGAVLARTRAVLHDFPEVGDGLGVFATVEFAEFAFGEGTAKQIFAHKFG